MADLLPKDCDGKPLGHVPEFQYKVVDLPAWDFDQLVGGPILRLALDILKKMIESDGDEFSETLLPLLEISDEEQKIELTKEAVDFFVKAFAAHNRRVDEAMLSQALKPIFKDKERTMIKTIFDEKYEEGVAIGEAKAIIKILTRNFGDVPPTVCDKLYTIRDFDALSQLTDIALDCQSLSEFEQELNK